MGGVSAWHLRRLCDNPWHGGGGYTPAQVGQMTLDQIWFCLCDINILKKEIGMRTKQLSTLDAMAVLKPDADGMIKGRTADGKQIRGRFGGKSKARMLMEEAEKKHAAEREHKKRRR